MMTASSTLYNINPEELRPLVHAELDKLPDHCLEAARKLLQELQLRELVESLCAEMDEARKAGRFTEESIAAAIQEHRQKHPYH